jgi:hypothetical protein
MESSRWDKFRVLTIALIFSGALNIGLVTALVFSAFEDPDAPALSAKLAARTSSVEPANRQFLSDLLKLSFSELIVYLTNRDPVEDGYTKRDLALSVLTSSHHFDLEKALSAAPLQRRAVSLSPDQIIELYPGLADEQFQAIIRYAYQEKWPLTSKGLFLMLQKWPKNGRDPSLCEAFFSTPEFYALQTLFQKTEAPQDPYSLLDLTLEASWDVVEQFAQDQAKALDLSLDKRRSLLLSYLSLRCPAAANLLLKSDYQFAKTRLADGGVLLLLDLLREKTAVGERFCVDLLHSPRSDAVWKAAAEKLYGFAGDPSPVPFDRQVALARFDALPASIEPTPAPAVRAKTSVAQDSARFREHTVQDGDTLWKIARQHKVKVDDLIRLNDLEKDRLLPGMVLRIPHVQGTGSEPPR